MCMQLTVRVAGDSIGQERLTLGVIAYCPSAIISQQMIQTLNLQPQKLAYKLTYCIVLTQLGQLG